MADMKPFTFALMLTLQRVDDALRHERLKTKDNAPAVAHLRRRRMLIIERLKRSLAPRFAEN